MKAKALLIIVSASVAFVGCESSRQAIQGQSAIGQQAQNLPTAQESARIQRQFSLINDPDPMVRFRAAQHLVPQRGQEMQPDRARAVDALLGALNDTNADVRAAAASSLGAWKDSRAVEPLIAALKDGDEVRAEAATSLGELGDRRAVEPLIGLLQIAVQTNDSVSVNRAADSLVQLKDPRTAGVLLAELSTSASFWDRSAMPPLCNALIQLGQPGSEDAMISAFNRKEAGGGWQEADREVAEDFLNSGNPKLEDTAREWADAHGVKIQTVFSSFAGSFGWGGASSQVK